MYAHYATSEFSWPEREDAKGDAPGYHSFFRKKSSSSEPHDWEPFLDAVSTQFGDDNLKAAVEAAVASKVNDELKTIPAIYELAVIHPSRPKVRVKCYVGKTMNFQKESKDVLAEESHYLKKFLRLALQHGNSVVRRYVYYTQHDNAGRKARKPVDVECLVGKTHERLLASYDWPWVEQAGSGSGTRGVYCVPRNALCCIPSGVDVIRIHPTMMN